MAITLSYRNVNDAFISIVRGIRTGSIKTEAQPSRNGEVLRIPEPCIISYRKPTERVLFNENRDCNPFFHVYESLWMLAGRNDIGSLQYYNSGYVYTDDGKTVPGAYGYRWRHAERYEYSDPSSLYRSENVDQLEVIIDHLKRKPESRRPVLQMWNVEDDLLKIDNGKDVCCNLCVLFETESGQCPMCNGKGWFPGKDPGDSRDTCPGCKGLPNEQPRYLNMTVFNRSNDLIWGTLGANVVHFSFLQEYMAAALGLIVGSYHQVSNNQHVYSAKWEPEKWLEGYDPKTRTMHDPLPFDYSTMPITWRHVDLVRDRATFDREVTAFCEENDGGAGMAAGHNSFLTQWSEPFLNLVAQPMMNAWHMHKGRDYEAARHWVDRIVADDWRHVCLKWIQKRAMTWKRKEKNDVRTAEAGAE